MNAMDDSGFEEDQVQLLADLTSQALLHQQAPAGGDQLQLLEHLVEAAAACSDVSPSSAAYLYGYTLCIGETLRYLAEQEGLSAEHPAVRGICQHMLAEYSRLVRRLCFADKPPAPAVRGDDGDGADGAEGNASGVQDGIVNSVHGAESVHDAESAHGEVRKEDKPSDEGSADSSDRRGCGTASGSALVTSGGSSDLGAGLASEEPAPGSSGTCQASDA